MTRGNLSQGAILKKIESLQEDIEGGEYEGQTVDTENMRMTLDALLKETEKIRSKFPVGSIVMVAQHVTEPTSYKEGVILGYTLDEATKSVHSRVNIQWTKGRGHSSMSIGHLRKSTLVTENTDSLVAILGDIQVRVTTLVGQWLLERSKSAVVDVTKDTADISKIIMKRVKTTKSNKIETLLNITNEEILRKAEDIFNSQK